MLPRNAQATRCCSVPRLSFAKAEDSASSSAAMGALHLNGECVPTIPRSPSRRRPRLLDREGRARFNHYVPLGANYMKVVAEHDHASSRVINIWIRRGLERPN